MSGRLITKAAMTRPRLILLLGAALAASLAASLAVGAAGLGVPDGWILLHLRLPRSLLAALIGASLGLSGAALQGVLRNGLADPGFLGIGATAALGSAVVFYWGFAAAAIWVLPAGGMLGAALGLLVLWRLAGPTPDTGALVLAGLALSSLAAALLSLALTLAPNPFALAELSLWLLGGLDDRGPWHLAFAAPPMLLGMALLLRLGPALDALTLGEATASSLGFPAAAALRRCGAGVALCVGAASAIAGGIGFVGLAVPHMLRGVLGERPGGLLLPSALLGAVLLLIADLAARAVPLIDPAISEPRLGVITALLGAPWLIAAIRRQHR